MVGFRASKKQIPIYIIATADSLTKPDDSEHDETLDNKNEPLKFLMCLLNAMFITVSELDLTKIFWRDPMSKNALQPYAWPDFQSLEYADQMTQSDVGMWLSRAIPGCLITKLLTDIGDTRKRNGKAAKLLPVESPDAS
ncbi:hypothetical protein EC957_008065 [Mortierella hygrophila]|uniref:Uncharacterized protein n=1 Tax=Mortierella hygrophila TaxID=979708 RepID=A0A9P6EX98_9FUNG|nr:hypothetical protein EC957_008065 [Mortierella hygrophila]